MKAPVMGLTVLSVAVLLAGAAFAAGDPKPAAERPRRLEIAWSVMHPIVVEPDYMRRLVAKAAEYGDVDSFEICGECNQKHGEYDLLGKPYLDNSRPERYPPAKVVETISRIFLEEHKRLGKRMIFRSFGSIESDYRDLIAGATDYALKDVTADSIRRVTISKKGTAYPAIRSIALVRV